MALHTERADHRTQRSDATHAAKPKVSSCWEPDARRESVPRPLGSKAGAEKRVPDPRGCASRGFSARPSGAGAAPRSARAMPPQCRWGMFTCTNGLGGPIGRGSPRSPGTTCRLDSRLLSLGDPPVGRRVGVSGVRLGARRTPTGGGTCASRATASGREHRVLGRPKDRHHRVLGLLPPPPPALPCAVGESPGHCRVERPTPCGGALIGREVVHRGCRRREQPRGERDDAGAPLGHLGGTPKRDRRPEPLPTNVRRRFPAPIARSTVPSTAAEWSASV